MSGARIMGTRIDRLKAGALTLVCCAWLTGLRADESTQSAVTLTFERDVRPILKAACFHCHGEAGETEGGLDLRLVRLMAAGGKSGSALAPGDASASLLLRRVASDEMPKGEKKLSAAQKETIRRWIEQGARTLRPEPADVEDARFTPEELGHWAFQPVGRPAVPRPEGYELATAIDGFVARRLKKHDLTFSPRAGRRTLIRRLTFDLTGLPPKPAEVDAFVADESPEAYGRLVDRLLASPQFGVRWGRHWLDVAGYAESDGGQSSDPKRPYAWRYRDYVIDAFNSGKPVDVFYHEQLAGDEIVRREIAAQKGGDGEAYRVDDARQLELLTATGFLRMAPDGTQSANNLETRNDATAAAMDVVSTSLVGLTVGCAQCHDHKYDPIGTDDYYSFRAIFDPAFPLQRWQQPSARLIDMTTANVRAERDRIEREAKKLDDDWNSRRQAVGEKILELKLADVPEPDRQATRAAVLTPGGQRTEEQRRLLDAYPMVKPVGNILGLLIEYDGVAFRKFEKERAKITELRATKPPLRMVMATTEQIGVVPKSSVFFRGNPESPRGEVFAC